MPTVPSSCVPVASHVSDPLSDPDYLASDDHSSGPTPDPDTDDCVLIPADVGNAVSQHSIESTPPQPIVRPRIELDTLVLHSPSSIVGTPFDPSPRFEYPFPAPGCTPQFGNDYDPMHTQGTMFSSSSHAAYPSVPPLAAPANASSITYGGAVPSKVKVDVRGFSPTHIKLNPRDPPVPPRLAKRRLHRNGAVDPAAASAPDALLARPRGESLSDLSDKLAQLAAEQPGLEDSAETGRAIQVPWSSAQNAKWKRNTLTLGESLRRSRTPDFEVFGLGSAPLKLDRATISLSLPFLLCPFLYATPTTAFRFGHIHASSVRRSRAAGQSESKSKA
ncbi:hypothetical protein OH76DRAFT_1550616 [Lentinus brumalis]|uniref:Uncharacterized protein n=1 Tax=Lentinus brumalis TaxID=2498619 RepID=A0A371DXR5_9APHY|nr:hypothetical protein OH76DRAFT_1550616 [Polyporus brumalis]